MRLAGAVGLEPTHNGFRDRRATDTLHPDIKQGIKIIATFD